MYDVIVVGARCGGASTSLLLARKGYRVLMVDRATFPSDMRLSTHLVWPSGLARLARWGLLDALAATGCPPLAAAVFDLGPLALRGGLPPVDGIGHAFVPRRRVLDGLLVGAAVAAGAELWEGRVGGGAAARRGRGCRHSRTIRWTAGDRVGVAGRRRGRHAVPGRRARGRARLPHPARRAGGVLELLEWCAGGVGAVPARRPDGLHVPDARRSDPGRGQLADRRLAERPRGHRGEHVRAVADADPLLAERLAAGRREERWAGAAVPGFFRRPFGPGWALVGDAGYTKDPCTGQGISDAFVHAEWLAEAVDDGLTGRYPIDAALAGYHRRRDAAVGPMYEFTCAMARMEPPTPEQAAMFAALAADRAATERFFGVFAGSVAVADFFGAPADAAA